MSTVVASSVGLWAGGVLVFVALLAVVSTLLRPKQRTIRLDGPRTAQPGSSPSVLTGLAQRLATTAEHQLEGRDLRRGIDAALEHAGITIRVGEFLVLAITTTAGVFVLGAALMGPVVGFALAAVAAFVPRAYVSRRRDHRRAAFSEQVPDLLQMVAGSLRTGYGLLQAVDATSVEMESPAADELRRVTTEVRLGRDVVDALQAMSERMANEDFEWVVQAIRIHREVGGDLGEVLDRVGDTIRGRSRLQRQVRALSAEGRTSAWVLTLLPFIVAAFMSITNREYVHTLFHGIGLAMLGMSAVLMTFGVLWLRKLIEPSY